MRSSLASQTGCMTGRKLAPSSELCIYSGIEREFPCLRSIPRRSIAQTELPPRACWYLIAEVQVFIASTIASERRSSCACMIWLSSPAAVTGADAARSNMSTKSLPARGCVGSSSSARWRHLWDLLAASRHASGSSVARDSRRYACPSNANASGLSLRALALSNPSRMQSLSCLHCIASPASSKVPSPAMLLQIVSD